MKLITAWLTCRPGARDEFLALMVAPSEATRREAGCLFFEFHPDETDPDGVVLIEGFRTPDDHEVHRHTAHMVVLQTELRRLVARFRLIEAVDGGATDVLFDFIANPPGPWKP